ncbi:MAG: DUF488 domain-containing protein [Patescibacteria group bacterium]|nr:DUF488 domain-containing protein [Patescibacteria group bacterium]
MIVWTIGHSSRPFPEFVQLLKNNSIDRVVDVRSLPGSTKFPWFNKEVMPDELEPYGIAYTHIIELGGRRNKSRTVDPRLNAGWKNDSFKNYADYTWELSFEDGLEKLLALLRKSRVAYFCSEAVPWKCHRSILSDALTVRGIEVRHIIDLSEPKVHQITRFCQPDGTSLVYPSVGGV